MVEDGCNRLGDTAAEMTGDALCFAFLGRTMLVKAGESGAIALPRPADLRGLLEAATDRTCVGRLAGAPCWAVGLADQASSPPAGLSLRDLRVLLEELPPDQASMASRATQLLHWRRLHRHCGSCGTPMADVAGDGSRRCPSCGLNVFPRQSPAIIVAVVREGRILLAHGGRFPAALYSVLAGFVEPGEGLEACVRREVREEVGIEIENLRYFGSQSWPFPDSLMIGFLADHAAGEIRADGAEIQDAGWFGPHELPRVPNRTSISGQLIDWFVNAYGGEH